MSTFEIVSGVEGYCLVLDGTRICGPKPWGGGRIVKTFRTDGIYEAINKDKLECLKAENAKLRELVSGLEYCVQGLVCDCCPLYDPSDTNHRRCEILERELGIEVE